MLHTEAVENKKYLYFQSVRMESPESTLSAIPKTTEIHESPQRLELSGLFLFLRFRDVHERP